MSEMDIDNEGGFCSADSHGEPPDLDPSVCPPPQPFDGVCVCVCVCVCVFVPLEI
jgi:hypothetical protein